MILKPLQGSGGKNVFKIASPKDSNLNQIFEAVSGEGYLIAQGFMPEAAEGDVRFFLMNGRPLQRDGKYAAFRRAPAKGEVRSNIHAGGSAEAIEVNDTMLGIAEMVRPKLVAGRHVPGRARHRRRQAAGDQRVHARAGSTICRRCMAPTFPRRSSWRWRKKWPSARPMLAQSATVNWRRSDGRTDRIVRQMGDFSASR